MAPTCEHLENRRSGGIATPEIAPSVRDLKGLVEEEADLLEAHSGKTISEAPLLTEKVLGNWEAEESIRREYVKEGKILSGQIDRAKLTVRTKFGALAVVDVYGFAADYGDIGGSADKTRIDAVHPIFRVEKGSDSYLVVVGGKGATELSRVVLPREINPNRSYAEVNWVGGNYDYDIGGRVCTDPETGDLRLKAGVRTAYEYGVLVDVRKVPGLVEKFAEGKVVTSTAVQLVKTLADGMEMAFGVDET